MRAAPDTVVLGRPAADGRVATEISGIRAGRSSSSGSAFANLGNYVFHLVRPVLSDRRRTATSRRSRPSPGSSACRLAAYRSSSHVTSPPSRQKSRPLNDDGYVSAFSGACLLAGSVLTLALLALAPVIQRALSIGSFWAVVFTILFTAPSFLAPALLGAAQGRQRFVLIAVATGVPPMVRIVLVAGLLAAGYGATGAMAATFASAVVGILMPRTPCERARPPPCVATSSLASGSCRARPCCRRLARNHRTE